MIIHVKGDIIEVKGSLVENHWLALKSAVSLLLERHPSGVVVDGSGLTDINEPGAHTFLDATNYIQAHNARVVVAGLPDGILEQIRQIPGARSQLPLAASVEEARASLAAGGVEAVPEARRKPAILVPLLGAWERAIQFAAIHAAKKAEVHLLYVIEVPRALPLGVPLPAEEEQATKALAEAERALSRLGVTVRKMTTRARVAIEGAGKFASEIVPRLVVVAYTKEELKKGVGGHDIIGTLCGEAPSDIGFFCLEAVSDDARVRPKAQPKPAILVPLIGAWGRAIGFAADHAAAAKAELHLLYVLEVPRTLPLDTPLPEKEQEAQHTLSEAEMMLRRRGVTVRKLTTRARDALEGAARFAAQTESKLLVAAYSKEDLIERGARHTAVNTLCHEAPCDIAVYCIAPE